jgi:small subunit ribosomal protein S8
MMTDPIADMLTRVRNACGARKRSVDIPSSKFKVAIAEVLLRERFIKDYKVVEDGKQGILKIQLKYTRSGDSVIRGIKQMSRVSEATTGRQSSPPRRGCSRVPSPGRRTSAARSSATSGRRPRADRLPTRGEMGCRE